MRFSLIILLFTLVLAACGGMAKAISDPPQVPDSGEDVASGEGMGRMGSGMGSGMNSGNGMMARHHAAVPQEYAGLTNSVAVDEESLLRGEEIYTTYCVVCHGESGMGDGAGAANLDPAPAAVAHTSRMLGDDYLYWRISEGGSHDPFNSAMPAWESAFDETARWDVINYLRALSSGEMMGGQAVQGEDHSEMLETAVTTNLITQTEADTFELVHSLMDELMAGGPPESGSMGQTQTAMLAELLEVGKITQAQIDSFNDVHDHLLEAGLME